MNSAGKHAVIVLLGISIAGCTEKKPVVATPPPHAQAPATPNAGKAGAMYPPPLTPTQPEPETTTPPPAPTVAKTETPPPPAPEPAKTKKPATTKKTKPSAAKPANATDKPADATDTPATPGTSAANAPATPPANSATTVAEGGEPAAISPIGELSTGDVAGQAQTRKDTVDIITGTESGVDGIKRTLTAQEQETVAQIRAFLNKAREALKTDDLDGAHTLATKAKVLLDELNKT
jgi:outer membrane biosynthesis protein TonB